MVDRWERVPLVDLFFSIQPACILRVLFMTFCCCLTFIPNEDFIGRDEGHVGIPFNRQNDGTGSRNPAQNSTKKPEILEVNDQIFNLKKVDIRRDF